MPYHWKFDDDYRSRSMSVLDTALNHLTAYQAWRAFDPGDGRSIDERYAAMPALTKQDIREHFPEGFLTPDHDVKDGLASGEIAFVQTSGTADMKVTNIWNQKWWDAAERASWKLNAHASNIASGSHPEAILANPINVGFTSDDADLPMGKRRLSRFLYLNEKSNPTLWSSQLMDRMVEELQIFQPAILEANPSLLAKLCRYIAANNKTVFQPGMIVLTYEYPTQLHYRQMRRVFNVPIANSYGSTETGYVFMECEAGKLHQNSEFCRVDFQPFKPEHGGPSLGRILVTPFNNPWYYLVRFDVTDLVRIEESGKCSCGRDSGMILSAIEGRVASVTLTQSGRLVTLRELDNVLVDLQGIEEYQLIQTTANGYELHLVSQRQDTNKLSAEATALLKRLYGEKARISVIYEEAIPPEISGKYLPAKALFPVNIDPYLDEKYLPSNIQGGR